MSVSDPPLQNLERSRDVRDAFVPREGNTLLLADYDQIELRLLAHYAEVPSMLEAANAGQNLHKATARAIYNLAHDAVIPKRQYGTTKNASFAKIYGAGLTTFAETAGIDEATAAAFMAEYDRTLPQVVTFMNQVIDVGRKRAREDGGAPHVITFFGRRLECSPKKVYKLVNYLIQGTAADVLKRAMVRCDAAGLLDYMVLPVHDEFVLDLPTGQAEEMKRALVEVMQDVDTFKAPLTVDAELFTRWGDKYADY